MNVFYSDMKHTLLLVLAILGVAMCGCKKENPATVFYTELHSVDKLVFASMSISKMATIDDIKLEDAQGVKQTADALLSAMKIGKRKAAYSYDTYMRAYIDLSSLNPDDVVVDEDAKTVKIWLPAVQTEFAGRDLGLREDHYRVTGLRSGINPEERAQIKERMNSHLKEEVEKDDSFRKILVEQAQNKARRYFEGLFAGSGYTPIIKFRAS